MSKRCGDISLLTVKIQNGQYRAKPSISKEGVTTKPDECKVVEQRLTLFEVHHYTPCVEEIV